MKERIEAEIRYHQEIVDSSRRRQKQLKSALVLERMREETMLKCLEKTKKASKKLMLSNQRSPIPQSNTESTEYVEIVAENPPRIQNHVSNECELIFEHLMDISKPEVHETEGPLPARAPSEVSEPIADGLQMEIRAPTPELLGRLMDINEPEDPSRAGLTLAERMDSLSKQIAEEKARIQDISTTFLYTATPKESTRTPVQREVPSLKLKVRRPERLMDMNEQEDDYLRALSRRLDEENAKMLADFQPCYTDTLRKKTTRTTAPAPTRMPAQPLSSTTRARKPTARRSSRARSTNSRYAAAEEVRVVRITRRTGLERAPEIKVELDREEDHNRQGLGEQKRRFRQESRETKKQKKKEPTPKCRSQK